jgi:hypothetical protein
MSDKHISSGTSPRLNDVIHSITEVGLGYQVSRELGNGAIVSLWSGFEWQQWENFSVSQNLDGDAESDVGFAGFVLGTGLRY